MKINLVNIESAMLCPICGRHGLRIVELTVSGDNGSVEFECFFCKCSIHTNNRVNKEFYERFAGDPPNYFKKEIEERENARTNG